MVMTKGVVMAITFCNPYFSISGHLLVERLTMVLHMQLVCHWTHESNFLLSDLTIFIF